MYILIVSKRNKYVLLLFLTFTCVLSQPAMWTIQVSTTEYMCTVPTGNLDYTGGYHRVHVYCPHQQPGLCGWVPQSTCVLSPPATWTIRVVTTEYMCTVPTSNLDYTGGYHRVHMYCPHQQPGLYGWVPQSTCVLSPPATWTIQVGTTEYMCTVPTSNLGYTGVHGYCPQSITGTKQVLGPPAMSTILYELYIQLNHN